MAQQSRFSGTHVDTTGWAGAEVGRDGASPSQEPAQEPIGTWRRGRDSSLAPPPGPESTSCRKPRAWQPVGKLSQGTGGPRKSPARTALGLCSEGQQNLPPSPSFPPVFTHSCPSLFLRTYQCTGQRQRHPATAGKTNGVPRCLSELRKAGSYFLGPAHAFLSPLFKSESLIFEQLGGGFPLKS